jgi:formiminotetrahydrofolate cyclodeaminase
LEHYLNLIGISMNADKKLAVFLDELASAEPTPGGGGAAAICGAMASALTSMVCNLTIGKKKYLEVSEQMKGVLAQSEELRREFLKLSDEDARAFQGLISAFKMPQETEEQKSLRSEAIQRETMNAAMVPMEVIRKCKELLPLSGNAAEKGNINAISDAGVSALLLGAAAQSAALNVNINLSGIKDRQWAEVIFKEMTDLLNEIRLGTGIVLKTVSEKIGN